MHGCRQKINNCTQKTRTSEIINIISEIGFSCFFGDHLDFNAEFPFWEILTPGEKKKKKKSNIFSSPSDYSVILISIFDLIYFFIYFSY